MKIWIRGERQRCRSEIRRKPKCWSTMGRNGRKEGGRQCRASENVSKREKRGKWNSRKEKEEWMKKERGGESEKRNKRKEERRASKGVNTRGSSERSKKEQQK